MCYGLLCYKRIPNIHFLYIFVLYCIMRIEKISFTTNLIIAEGNSIKITIPKSSIDKVKQNFNRGFKNGEVCDFTMEFIIKDKEEKNGK